MKSRVIYHPQGDNPPKATLYYGKDVRESLRNLPDNSIHTICTSPPYWGLRDYGVELTVWGGDPKCNHEFTIENLEYIRLNPGGIGWYRPQGPSILQEGTPGFCHKCGAWRGCFGLEPAPQLYVKNLVEIAREFRRVLRPDGVFWLNLGDTYVSHSRQTLDTIGGIEGDRIRTDPDYKNNMEMLKHKPNPEDICLKEKDLVGVPWRAALALQDDGWWLRRDIIWDKPNPMPESILDRASTAHEYIFMMTKSKVYYYDQEAVREPCVSGPSDIKKMSEKKDRIGGKHLDLNDPLSKANKNTNIGQKRAVGDPISRNLRSIWRISTSPYPGAHFATWPPKLVEKMILAGTSEKGCCAKCGAPLKRIVEKKSVSRDELPKSHPEYRPGRYTRKSNGDDTYANGGGQRFSSSFTAGWEPTCSCGTDLPSDSWQIINTPTGNVTDPDPSIHTGRAGFNRPRGDDEGRRPITRYEQREYAKQLDVSPHRQEMMSYVDKSTFDHYIRTDVSGARPIPPDMLDEWIDKGWIKRVHVPDRPKPDTCRCVVLDPFSGSGTTGQVALQHGRDYIGIDLNDNYFDLAQNRIVGVKPSRSKGDDLGEGSIFDLFD